MRRIVVFCAVPADAACGGANPVPRPSVTPATTGSPSSPSCAPASSPVSPSAGRPMAYAARGCVAVAVAVALACLASAGCGGKPAPRAAAPVATPAATRSAAAATPLAPLACPVSTSRAPIDTPVLALGGGRLVTLREKPDALVELAADGRELARTRLPARQTVWATEARLLLRGAARGGVGRGPPRRSVPGAPRAALAGRAARPATDARTDRLRQRPRHPDGRAGARVRARR